VRRCAVQTVSSTRWDPATPPNLAPAAERCLLSSVEQAYATGLALYRWWGDAYASRSLKDRFEETLTFNRPESSFGFFDDAPIGTRSFPVMGNFQTIDYDHSKSPADGKARAADEMRLQLRDFVLRYFLRVSDFRQPEAVRSSRAVGQGPGILNARDLAAQRGFGFSQLYYKLLGTNRASRFPEAEQHAIVDLRELGLLYDWVLLWVQIFDFQIRLAPLGGSAPSLSVPLSEGNFLLASPELIICDDSPEDPEELGRYGLGYIFIKNPTAGIVRYGPGAFEAGFESIQFIIYKDGRVRADLAFVSNVPEQILNISLDPIFWTLRGWDVARRSAGFGPSSAGTIWQRISPLRDFDFDPVFGFIRVANQLTRGLAGREFHISRRELLKAFLLQHFHQHYQTITGSLRTWRQIPDWTDAAALPAWVITGTSA